MPSNFKKLVRARMAETGETWQTAARRVREGAKPEAWRNFQPGDRLVLTRPISDTEKDLIGQGHTFTFVEYTRPHGYARCRDGEHGTWLLHPEALEEATLRNRIVGLLARHLKRTVCLERANNITQVMLLEPETDLDPLARKMLRDHKVPEAVLQNIGRLPLDKLHR